MKKSLRMKSIRIKKSIRMKRGERMKRIRMESIRNKNSIE